MRIFYIKNNIAYKRENYIYDLFIYNDFHTAQGSRDIRVRGLQSKKHSLCGYVGKIIINPRHE